MMQDKYQLVIGLEVHTQLQTQTKLFCADSIIYGEEPNTQVSPVSLAHPGTLPVLNKQAVELAVRLGLALHCSISEEHHFDRKHYFYPDLPKGYQVSQQARPVCLGGYLPVTLEGVEKKILLNRIHIEEDAGKSLHDIHENFSAIDLNRAGTPLLEIVTEPVIHSAEEAYIFLIELRKLVRWLEVCDGNMEEGSMRCDANISVRHKGSEQLGTRVEVKNLNSIRNVKKAIEVEGLRLMQLLEEGKAVIQQTRSYNADNNSTFALRNKEEAEDYRYFPDPDLPVFIITKKHIEEIKNKMPALPWEASKELETVFQLSAYDASLICNDKDEWLFFHELVKLTSNYKAAANWQIGPIKSYCKDNQIEIADFPLSQNDIAALIDLTADGKISFQNASGKLMQQMIKEPGKTALDLATSLNLMQQTDENELLGWIESVLESMPEQVKAYQKGKRNLIGLFAGEVKKKSKGKADMQLSTKLLTQKLNEI